MSFAKVFDSLRVVHEGENTGLTSREFAVTITSRATYHQASEFREKLHEFLNNVGYSHNIDAVCEYHTRKGSQDKIHAHGFVMYGNPPKGNRLNPFNFKIKKITNRKQWVLYCLKRINDSLARSTYLKIEKDTENERGVQDALDRSV